MKNTEKILIGGDRANNNGFQLKCNTVGYWVTALTAVLLLPCSCFASEATTLHTYSSSNTTYTLTTNSTTILKLTLELH